MKPPILFLLVLSAAVVSACTGLRGKRDHFRIRELTAQEKQRHGLYNLRFIDRRADPKDDLVQLVQRRSLIAPRLGVHPLFRTYDQNADRWGEWDLYALWATAYREEVNTVRAPSADGSTVEETEWTIRRWGNIDKIENMTFIVNDGVVTGEWHGEEARAILSVLSRPEEYPLREAYRYWPGPNSNTYAAWILRQAGVRMDLHPQAVGKDYLGPWGFGAWTTTTRTGVQVESPVVGFKIGLMDGAEIHLLCLTLGLDLWPPALKTPLGRFGMVE